MPSNFKTYEAQSRLLAALLASDPSLKLNFKAIAKHYGSDTSTSGIEHRFRPIKKAAAGLRQVVAEGKDAKDYSACVTMNEKEIAKYFGESTPMGIEFQFRSIKKEAKALRAAHESGTPLPPTPSAARTSSAASTPRSGAKRKAPASASATPKSTASASTPGTGNKRAARASPAKKQKPAAAAAAAAADKDSYESTEDDVDYDALDVTPTKSSVAATAAAKRLKRGSTAASPIPDGLGGDFVPPFAYPMSGALPTPRTTGGMGSTPEVEAKAGVVGDDDDDDDGFAIVEKPVNWPSSSFPSSSASQPLPLSQSQQAPVFSQRSNASSIFGGGGSFGNGSGINHEEIDYSAGMVGQDSFSLEDGEI